MASRFAKVVIDSPLPQLDRPFEYVVPEPLEVVVGARVRVPFGRAANQVDGFVIAVTNQREFVGELAELASITSALPALMPNIYRLARTVADRQAATINDVLKLAVPTRSVAVENKWLALNVGFGSKPKMASVEISKTAHLAAPFSVDDVPAWCQKFIDAARAQVSAGHSTLICLPDFRDFEVLSKCIQNTDLAQYFVDYSASRTASKRYSSFLSCLTDGPHIVVGNRAAIYAPVQNLGLICVWDDADQSHIEPSAPYSHTREVALIRQSLEKCSILFSSHSRSTEIQRLIEIGFLTREADDRAPKIRVTESETRIDGQAWSLVRTALKHGPVLVQVSTKGTSKSAYCSSCSDRAKCGSCNGPIWIDQSQAARCRWCYQTNLNFTCNSCGAKKLRAGRPGSTRTIADFGRAFPGIQIIESTGDTPIQWLKSGRKIVVSTPGAEPRIEGGYVAVVLLDCNDLISRDSLRASEEAIRVWSNAVALQAENGLTIAVGLSGPIAKKFADWNLDELAENELRQRRELRFPPAVRMASLTGERDLLHKVLTEIENQPGVEILGPMPLPSVGSNNDWRALLRFEYSQGAALSSMLKAQILLATAGSKRVSSKSGRAVRPIKINMDDSEVI